MNRFVDRFRNFCTLKGTTPYKVAQETGVDTSLVSNWMSGKREPKPATVMECLQKFSKSENLGVDYPTLASWWVQEFIPKEAFIAGVVDITESDSGLKSELQKALNL